MFTDHPLEEAESISFERGCVQALAELSYLFSLLRVLFQGSDMEIFPSLPWSQMVSDQEDHPRMESESLCCGLEKNSASLHQHFLVSAVLNRCDLEADIWRSSIVFTSKVIGWTNHRNYKSGRASLVEKGRSCPWSVNKQLK
ncbi:uncharacterized protein LOC143439152 [Arvicanthis niloticus]|uniref:uncharacterized protein LOC143439152 n=1 Tax=Arvicanthis niloticus TaxID=61156 RepID=UPI00403CA3F0